MNQKQFRFAVLSALALGLSACQKNENPAGELEKAAAAMAKAPAAPAPAPAAADSGNSLIPTEPPPAKQMEDALADYKAGKMEDAVNRLQLLRGSTALSPEQRMAMQDGVAAVMRDLYARAEKGDAQAAAAVARYEKLQNAR